MRAYGMLNLRQWNIKLYSDQELGFVTFWSQGVRINSVLLKVITEGWGKEAAEWYPWDT